MTAEPPSPVERPSPGERSAWAFRYTRNFRFGSQVCVNILFDINHPADVHFFRHAIAELQAAGHRILITAREKDVTLSLLDRFGLAYIRLSTARPGLLNLGWELICRNIKMIRLYRRELVALSVAFTGASIGQVGRLLGVPSLVFYDNEQAWLQNWLTFPFATRIYTPACFRDDLGPKQIRFNGVKELAYLHPNRYRPDPSVLELLGVAPGQAYVVIRSIAWAAAHDVGQTGLGPQSLLALAREVSLYARVYVVAETALAPELEPYRVPVPIERIHDVLAYAAVFIGEGPTMVCESACLGIPAIYLGSLMPSPVTVLEEAGLIFHVPEHNKIVPKVLELLRRSTSEDWHRLARAFVDTHEDVTAWIVREILEFVAARSH